MTPAPTVTPTPNDVHAARARLIEYVAPAPLSSICGLANAQFCTGLVNPQFSIFAVEASASQIVNESAPPVFKQVHREQIAAEQECVERVQLRTVEHIVHVPIPQIQEDFVERVQKIPQERLPERIEEPIENTPIPHSISYSAPAPVIENISPAVPAIEYVAPAPVIEHEEPAPVIEYIAPAPPQVKVQENLEVQTIERIQKQIVPERPEDQIRDIPSVMEVSVPAASLAALDSGLFDGFQHCLTNIGTIDLNTLTKQQLDDITKVILPYSKAIQDFA